MGHGGAACLFFCEKVIKGQLLITHALLGHYHTELHEAEAPPEDIQSLSRQDEIAIEIELNEMQ